MLSNPALSLAGVVPIPGALDPAGQFALPFLPTQAFASALNQAIYMQVGVFDGTQFRLSNCDMRVYGL